jgi:hypothetical protein
MGEIDGLLGTHILKNEIMRQTKKSYGDIPQKEEKGFLFV